MTTTSRTTQTILGARLDEATITAQSSITAAVVSGIATLAVLDAAKRAAGISVTRRASWFDLLGETIKTTARATYERQSERVA